MKIKDKRLTRNAARCKFCGDVIESKHRHDYVSCGCGKISVDGGLSYTRRSFPSDAASYEDAVEELSEYEEYEREPYAWELKEEDK